jgi:plastocyanin
MRRFAGCLLALGLLLLASGPVAARPATSGPSTTAVISPQVNFTLYGDAGLGWGFSSGSLSRPGPRMEVHLGDSVSLTLIGTDAPDHNWFLTFSNSSEPRSDEPKSDPFRRPTPIPFSFNATRSGNWTYRCEFHPGSMWGVFSVLARGRPLNATLVGSASRGWGQSNATISSPGPEIVVGAGAPVTLTLFANDTNERHDWFIDYNGNQLQERDEPGADNFNGPGDPKAETFPFNATRPGAFTYRCEFHPTRMFGTVRVLGEAAPPSGLGLGIVPGVLLVALAGVLVFAVVYEVRARRTAKRPK